MRKAFVVLTVLGALAALAPPVGATLTDVNQLGAGTWQAKYSDYSDLYAPPAKGSTVWTPEPFAVSPPILGSEDRAIFYTTSIQPVSGPPAAWLPGTPPAGQQLTGIFYNLSLAFAVSSGSTLNLYFTQSSRNPLPGTPAGYGGVIEVYVSPTSTTPNFTANPGSVSPLSLPVGGKLASTVNAAIPAAWGPSYWVQGSGGASRDTYTGATTGTLWLSGTFVDWKTLALVDPVTAANLAYVDSLDPGLDPVFSETLDLGTGTGSGTGDIHLLGGSFFSSVTKGNVGLGPNVDMTLLSDVAFPTQLFTPTKLFPSTGNYTGVGWWPVDSQDPVNFNIIPEPATMTLFGLGLVGIGAIRRRMRKG